MDKPVIDVCAAVIRRGRNVLVSRRKNGDASGGYYEFPGGKFEPGENLAEATERELFEELGIRSIVLDEIGCKDAHGREKIYRLHFVRVLIAPDSPEPYGREGQKVQWIPVSDLLSIGLLPSDNDFAGFLILADKTLEDTGR